MKLSLHSFLDRHCGRGAVLYGSGPSLEVALADEDAIPVDVLHCAVNETALKLDRVDYVFANDVQHWVAELPASVTLFHPRRTACGPAQCNVCAFDDAADASRLTALPESLARSGLFAGEGTINSAIQVLAIMGIEEVLCVGIDGDHAPYDRLRKRFEAHAARLGVELYFYGEEEAE